MLNNLSDQVRECLQHAETCARKAASATDAGIKQSYLELERNWLTLARSFQTGERLAEFNNEVQRRSSDAARE